MYEGKNANVAPLLLYTGPTLADSKALCRVFTVAFPPLVHYGTTFPPLCGGTMDAGQCAT